MNILTTCLIERIEYPNHRVSNREKEQKSHNTQMLEGSPSVEDEVEDEESNPEEIK